MSRLPICLLVACASVVLFAGSGCGGSDADDADARVTDDGSPEVSDGSTLDALARDAADIDASTEVTSVLYYWGDFDDNSQYRVARVEFPARTKTTLSLAQMTVGVEIETVALSPDKTKVAVAGRKSAGNAPVINVYDADGSGDPTTIYTGAQSVDFAMFSYSPDGSTLAFLADIDLDNSMALYVAPAAGGAAPKRVSLAPVSVNQFISSYEWAADSAHIAFTGDLQADGIGGLWTVDTTAGSPSPVAIVTLDELTASDNDRDVDDVIDFDGLGRLYFRSDHEAANNLHRLYRCNLDGSSRVQVPGTDLTHSGGGSEAPVGPFAISSAGAKLAFFSESPQVGLYQVYVMPLSGSTAAVVSNVTSTPGAAQGPDLLASRPVVWSPDESTLAVIADWPVEGSEPAHDFAAFILPATPPAGGVRVLKTSATGGDALELAFTPDSARIVIRADVVEDGAHELFTTTDFVTADQDPAVISLEEVPENGDVWGFVGPR